jgi:hypothetical protein
METIKNLSWGILGIAIIIGLAVLVGLLMGGGLIFANRILPWIEWLSSITFLIDILFLPLSFFKKSRGVSSLVFFISSDVYGLELWIRSLLLTYILWGGFWVIIGLLFAGVGVLPMALLATIFSGQWGVFLGLVLSTIITYGTRVFAHYLADKVDKEHEFKIETEAQMGVDTDQLG